MPTFIRLPAKFTALEVLEPGRVRVGSQAVSVEVRLSTGETFPGGRGMPALGLPNLADTIGEVGLRALETDAGPRTELFAPSLTPGLTPSAAVHRLEGAPRQGVRAPGRGALVGLVTTTPMARGPRFDFTVTALALDPAPSERCGAGNPLRLPAELGSAVVAGEGFVACSMTGALHVARISDASGWGGLAPLGAITLPLPPTWAPTPAALAVDGRTLVALAGDVLVVLDVDALPVGEGHRILGLTLVPIEPRGPSHPEPAKVVFVMSDKVLADHPSLGRLQLPITPSTPTVARGDLVRIDDARQELPGIFRVYAWARPDDPRGASQPRPPLVLPPPELELAMGDASSASKGSERAALEALARRHGLAVPPRLLRMLGLADEDPVFRRWLEQLWLELEVRSLVGDWQADPSLLAFAGLGNGDAWCLYVHPDAPADSVVLFSHETNAVDELPTTFDAWLDAHLAGFETEQPGRRFDPRLADLATRVRAALEVPSRAPVVAPPASALRRPPTPFWWQAASLTGDFSVPLRVNEWAETNLAAGRMRDAERWVLARYLRGDLASRDALLRVYEALGWAYQLEQLQADD